MKYNELQITFNADCIKIEELDDVWLQDIFRNTPEVITFKYKPNYTYTIVLDEHPVHSDKLLPCDIMALLHIMDSIENILKRHAGLTGELSSAFIEGFRRVAKFGDSISLYADSTFKIRYRLIFDNELVGDPIDHYFDNFYNLKPSGRNNDQDPCKYNILDL